MCVCVCVRTCVRVHEPRFHPFLGHAYLLADVVISHFASKTSYKKCVKGRDLLTGPPQKSVDRNGWVFDGPQRYTTTLPTDRLRCRHHRYGFYRAAEKVHRGRGGGGGGGNY